MSVDNILACPSCGSSELNLEGAKYHCFGCQSVYPILDQVPVFLRSKSKILSEDVERAKFWDEGWEKRNSFLLKKDREDLIMERQRYWDYLYKSGYPSVVDISPELVSGKTFLNIGCGAGFEGLLFSGFGAEYIGVDFSHNAGKFTKLFIDKAGFNGRTFQAEAEALPFQNDSIDYIYSSGVLHHTPDTPEALKEAWRVLKPGGTAMIGLYATYSVMFLWYRFHAILRGNLTKHSIDDWVHGNTEGDWQTEGRRNYWTKTYTKSQFSLLLKAAGFSNVNIIQCPIQVKILPIFGIIVRKFCPTWVGDLRLGPMGGMLVATCVKN